MQNSLQLKVCGMRSPENIAGLVELAPDYMGLIFYERSTRFVEAEENLTAFESVPSHIQKVGVFVNATIAYVREKVSSYHLDLVQLHGAESPAYCQELKEAAIKVIKVFSVEGALDLQAISSYEGIVDYFLFDTKTPKHGGSGKTFDWSVLQAYNLPTPYFLSGGLSLENLETLDPAKMPGLIGLDVNSKFETSPGYKNLQLIEALKKLMNDKLQAV